MPCYQIFSSMIFKELNNTFYRHAVNMHINRRHENRNLFPFSFKVFGLLRFFNHNYFTISRSNNMFWIFLNRENGDSEKLKDDQIKNNTTADHNILNDVVFRNKVLNGPVERKENN